MLGYLSELYHTYISPDERFYYLALIKEHNNSISIHGLWPQTNKVSYPSFCKNVDFNMKELTPIIDKLNKYWYSDCEKNEDFWKHEYQKHGSCMFKEMSEFDYFSKTLELYESALKTDKIKLYLKKYPNSKTIKLQVDLDFNLI